jgi:hypothetical protein
MLMIHGSLVLSKNRLTQGQNDDLCAYTVYHSVVIYDKFLQIDGIIDNLRNIP